MTAPTYAQWQQHRGCDRKVRHDTLLSARLAVLELWRSGLPGSAYQCRHCGGWHTTSNPNPSDPEVLP